MTQFVENLAINSTNHVVRRYAMIYSSKSVTLPTTIEPENKNGQIQKFPNFIVVYDRQQWLKPENSLKLVKAKYFHSSLSFTIDTAIIHLTVLVFLSGAMIASSQLSSLLIYSDCWVHLGFKLTKKTKTLNKRLQRQ